MIFFTNNPCFYIPEVTKIKKITINNQKCNTKNLEKKYMKINTMKIQKTNLIYLRSYNYYQQYSIKKHVDFCICKIQEAVIDYGKFKFKFKQFIQRKD